jgi:hypothetical protein
LDGLQTPPDKIVLHDPQGNLAEGNHDIAAPVETLDDATTAVIATRHHPRWY